VSALRNLLAVVTLALPLPALGQEQDLPPVSSTISSNERFEIVESPLAVRWTFRLDKFCGNISMIVKDSKDENHWETMRSIPQTTCGKVMHSHYQLFSSGLAAKMTFLMDTSSGLTWQLAHDPKTDENFWSLID